MCRPPWRAAVAVFAFAWVARLGEAYTPKTTGPFADADRCLEFNPQTTLAEQGLSFACPFQAVDDYTSGTLGISLTDTTITKLILDPATQLELSVRGRHVGDWAFRGQVLSDRVIRRVWRMCRGTWAGGCCIRRGPSVVVYARVSHGPGRCACLLVN
jgi:hypothetical protein